VTKKALGELSMDLKVESFSLITLSSLQTFQTLGQYLFWKQTWQTQK